MQEFSALSYARLQGKNSQFSILRSSFARLDLGLRILNFQLSIRTKPTVANLSANIAALSGQLHIKDSHSVLFLRNWHIVTVPAVQLMALILPGFFFNQKPVPVIDQGNNKNRPFHRDIYSLAISAKLTFSRFETLFSYHETIVF